MLHPMLVVFNIENQTVRRTKRQENSMQTTTIYKHKLKTCILY